MSVVLKYIISMYEKELYSNVVRTIDLTLSVADQKLDSNPVAKLQMYLYYADSHYHLQQYQQAEEAYSQALQVRKFIVKLTNGKLNENQEIASDIDIKYKMHMCYNHMRKTKKAVEILQSIPSKSRDSKINMALGNLLRDGGCEKSAISCYKEVLKENPLAIEAAENLFKLSVKGTDINSLMLEATTELGWLTVWLRGQAHMHSQDYHNAIKNFKTLDAHSLLKDSSALLVTIAHCYAHLCDAKSALAYLQRALRVDPNAKNGRDLCAALLARSAEKEHVQELERLANVDLDVNAWAAEHWVVTGYSLFSHKKYARACSFAQKAASLGPRNVEALLLKGYAFFEMNEHCKALAHFKEAMNVAPYRFEPYKGIVDCYLSVIRNRDAVNMALFACKELKNSPQALTLYAKILQKDSTMSSRVRDLLDKALGKDPSYLPAVWLLAEHLDREQRHEEACGLLRAHVAEYPSSRSHQLLGACLARLQREDEAVAHFSTAVRLDPANQQALDGLNAIGRGGLFDTTYYVSVGGGGGSAGNGGGGGEGSAPGGGPSDAEPDADSEPDLWNANGDPYILSYESN